VLTENCAVVLNSFAAVVSIVTFAEPLVSGVPAEPMSAGSKFAAVVVNTFPHMIPPDIIAPDAPAVTQVLKLSIAHSEPVRAVVSRPWPAVADCKIAVPPTPPHRCRKIKVPGVVATLVMIPYAQVMSVRPGDK
jgi:hypothetical protein